MGIEGAGKSVCLFLFVWWFWMMQNNVLQEMKEDAMI
jgi:low temperature requirement protein LtrA